MPSSDTAFSSSTTLARLRDFKKFRGAPVETSPSLTVQPDALTRVQSYRRREQFSAYLFLAPALLVFALFAWYPIVRSGLLSFQDIGLRELQAGDIGLINPNYYVGLENYDRMAVDPVFKAAWRNSFEFAGLSVVMGFFVPVLVAILVNEMRRAKGFFRLVYFLPNVIPGVIGLLVWQQIYRVPNGFLNTLLMELGFEYQTWIQDPVLAKPSMVLIMTWSGFGATALLYLASLQDLPTELYEAAEIDGASVLDRIQHITLPHLRPTMLVLLILQIIGVAQVFLEPFVLDNYPGQSATTPVLTIYRKAFLNGEYGLASAWSVLLIILLAGFSLIYLRLSRVLEHDEGVQAPTGAAHWTFYLVFTGAVIALGALALILDGFLGRDAAAAFVVLIGFVLLTYRLPSLIRRAVQGVIAIAALLFLSEVFDWNVVLSAAALAGVLFLLHRFDWQGAEHVQSGLQLAALLLVFAVGITLAGVKLGALVGVIGGALLLANLPLPPTLRRAAGVGLGGVLVALLASVIGGGLLIEAALVLGFLLLYQPHLDTGRGRAVHLGVMVIVFLGALRLAKGGSLSSGLTTQNILTGGFLGVVGNFLLVANPSGRAAAAWERGAISHAELGTWRGRMLYRAIALLLIVLAVSVVFPFVFAFTAGLKESNAIFRSGLQLWPDNPLWETYRVAWERFDILRLFRNTLIVVAGGMVMQIGISLLAAYSLSRLAPRGGRAILMGFLATLMIPSIAYLVPLYVTVTDLPVVHTSLLGSYWGIWLPYSASAFTIFVLKNYFDGLPSELFDAAKVDGAGPLQILSRIVLPLSRTILIVLSILTFVNLWRDFLWPYLVLLRQPQMQPISVYLYIVTTSSILPMNLQMASYFLAMLPPLIIAILLQRYMRQGLSIGAVKG